MRLVTRTASAEGIMVPNPGVTLAREMQTQMETRITPSDCVFVDDKSSDEDVAFCSEVNANAVETDQEDSHAQKPAELPNIDHGKRRSSDWAPYLVSVL